MSDNLYDMFFLGGSIPYGVENTVYQKSVVMKVQSIMLFSSATGTEDEPVKKEELVRMDKSYQEAHTLLEKKGGRMSVIYTGDAAAGMACHPEGIYRNE